MSRCGRRWLWVIAAVLGLAAAAQGAEPAALGTPTFLLGGDFPITPSPAVEQLFYQSGMNCIRLTGGGYAWATAGHKKLADAFEQRGLKVYLQLGSHYPSADYFPLKDAWFVDQAGKTGEEDRRAWSITYSGQHWPQYSYAAQDFRDKLKGDFATYLGHFKDNTNIAGVILHNEPGYFWLHDRLFDYGAPAVAQFKVWLKQQHGTTEALNKRWQTSYGSFDDVVPPKQLPPVDNVAAWMDWRRFQVDLVAQFMQWEADWFKTQMPGVPRTTNISGPLDHWYAYRCADIWALSRPMDVVGIDVYPSEWTGPEFVGYALDMAQGTAQGRPVQVLECETFGPRGKWKQYSEEQRAGLLRSELWTMAGHGAQAVLMWQISNGGEFSLTDGEYNPRVEVCRTMMAQAKMIGLGAFERPRPKVALCLDTDTYLYESALEGRPATRTAQLDSEAHGMYAALSDAGVPCDVLMTSQIAAGAWKNYQALVLVAPTVLDEKTAEALKAFMAGGGVVVSDGVPAERDAWGKALEPAPGLGLDELFQHVGMQMDPVRYGFIIDNIGAAYARGAGPRDLPQTLAGLLARRPGSHAGLFVGGGSISADASAGGEPRLDRSELADRQGNRLIVLTRQPDHLKLAAPAKDASVRLDGVAADQSTQVFVLEANAVHGKTTTSGVRKLATAVDRNKARGPVTVSVGEVASAVPVLVARNHGPLLASEVPTSVERGKPFAVRVTCYNPSPETVAGKVALDGSAGTWEGVVAKDVYIAPYGEQTVTLSWGGGGGGGGGGAVIRPVLRVAGGVVEGVPVDVEVGE